MERNENISLEKILFGEENLRLIILRFPSYFYFERNSFENVLKNVFGYEKKIDLGIKEEKDGIKSSIEVYFNKSDNSLLILNTVCFSTDLDVSDENSTKNIIVDLLFPLRIEIYFSSKYLNYIEDITGSFLELLLKYPKLHEIVFESVGDEEEEVETYLKFSEVKHKIKIKKEDLKKMIRVLNMFYHIENLRNPLLKIKPSLKLEDYDFSSLFLPNQLEPLVNI